MQSGLPFNLDDLLHQRAIESSRVEFKATWDVMELAAKILFDDRRSLEGTLRDLSPTLVRRFLDDH